MKCSLGFPFLHILSLSVSLSQVTYLEQLLACVDVLLCQCEADCSTVSLQLLQVLVTVQSASTEPQLSEKVTENTHIHINTHELHAELIIL